MSDFEEQQLAKIRRLDRKIADVNRRGAELDRIAKKWPARDGMPPFAAWLYLAGYSIDLWLVNRKFPLPK